MEYFLLGYQQFLEQITASWQLFIESFNLISAVDILLVAGLLYWLWSKIKKSTLTRLLPSFFVLLVAILLSKFLGFVALFYVLIFLFLSLLLAMILIHNQDIQKIVESSIAPGDTKNKIRPLDHHELNNFIRDLTDTVISLSRSKTPGLLIIKTTKPLDRLIDNGTALRTEFNRDFVVDIFSHRSKLAMGAIVIDSGTIVSVGSTLTASSPKKFAFSLSNNVLKQVALHWEAIVIITYKDADYVSLLHEDNSYSKLAPSSLERVLKTILISK